MTRAEHAHAVHVVAGGLGPARDYWYRFRCGSWTSPIGRARTAPAPGQRIERLSWATASCQAWQDGHYTAHRHLAAEDIDLVVFLGDYIYERPIERSVGDRSDDVGDDLAGEAETLDGYRLRYGLYKGDADLQAAHRAAPWIITCDDHEVQDGYAGTRPRAGSVENFAARRAAAYQAFWEHQPLRTGPPRGASLRLHRRATYGDLATFHLLDTRQHRSPIAAGDTWQTTSPTRLDPARTMLGEQQEQWLRHGLARSTTRWNIVAQQVLTGRLDLDPGAGALFNADAWDGYAAAQRRLHNDLAHSTNPVVLSGDVHAAYALTIEGDRGPTPAAVELATTSISSGGDGAPLLSSGEAFLDANAHLQHVDQRRGYLRCRLAPGELAADFRAVPFVERAGAPVTTARSFVVEDGRAALHPASA